MPVDGTLGFVRSSNANVVAAAVYPKASGPAPVAANTVALQLARARQKSFVNRKRGAIIGNGGLLSAPIETGRDWNYKENTG